MANDPKEETYSEEETKLRAAAALHRMLATPHKPHKRKGGEPKPSPKSQKSKDD
jgi:hypothetical protein